MKIGVVGLGSIGKRHVTNLLEMGGHDILGCDTRLGTDGWMSGLTIHAVSSVGAVWDWEPEIVIIATPPGSHYALAIQAIRRKIHCLIEKPIASTSKEADVLRWEAENFGAQLAVGYQLPFTDASFAINIRDWNNDLRVISKQDMSAWPSQYCKDALEEFSHDIHLAVFWNGPVEKVVASQVGSEWKIDLVQALARSYVHLNAAHPTLVRYATAEQGKWQFDHAQNDQAYKDELAAFLSVCQGGTWDDRLCTGAEAAHVVRIIEAARESDANCKIVTL